jgi:hypothetical protein
LVIDWHTTCSAVDVFHARDGLQGNKRSARKRRIIPMADCECLAGCIFFNDKMARKPATADIMKQRYCKGDSSVCARHMVLEKLGRPKVPVDLFPGDVERAMQIIGV